MQEDKKNNITKILEFYMEIKANPWKNIMEHLFAVFKSMQRNLILEKVV